MAYFHRFSNFVWTVEKIRMRYAVHVDTYIFENGGKNRRFQKYPDACRTEPKTSGLAWYSTKIWV